MSHPIRWRAAATAFVAALAVSTPILTAPAQAAPATRHVAAHAHQVDRYDRVFHPSKSDPEAMREAWRLWKSQHDKSYVLTVSKSCFCPVRLPMISTVRHGKITFVARKGAPGREIGRRGWTVDKLFYMIRAANRVADVVHVRYGRRGLPVSVSIDYIKNAIDDELYWGAHIRLG